MQLLPVQYYFKSLVCWLEQCLLKEVNVQMKIFEKAL